jgi:hypothetical protein
MARKDGCLADSEPHDLSRQIILVRGAKQRVAQQSRGERSQKCADFRLRLFAADGPTSAEHARRWKAGHTRRVLHQKGWCSQPSRSD